MKALYEALARVLEQKENVTIRVYVERRDQNEKNSRG